MTIDQTKIDAYENHTVKALQIEDFLRSQLKDPDIATLINQPIIQMLIIAADYLAANIQVLKVKYTTLNE